MRTFSGTPNTRLTRRLPVLNCEGVGYVSRVHMRAVKGLPMNILFYGTASYDRDSFTKELKDYPEIKIDFTETKR